MTRLRPLHETMTPAELTAYLSTNIPLTGAMDVSAISVAPDTVVLEAPLAPNINHRKTVFGGSASALGILAAWSLVHLRLAETKLEHRLVIQRNTMSYDAPIEGTFTATAAFAEGTDWPKFLDMLERRGKARIGAVAELSAAGRPRGAARGRLRRDPRALEARQLKRLERFHLKALLLELQCLELRPHGAELLGCRPIIDGTQRAQSAGRGARPPGPTDSLGRRCRARQRRAPRPVRSARERLRWR